MKLKKFFLFLILIFVFWPKNKVFAEGDRLELKWLLANPVNGPEEVFIYNPADKRVDLQGWQIDDIPQGSQPVSLSGYLASKSGLLIKLPKAIFNNSGDSCRLLNQGQVIEETAYPTAKKGVYWLKDRNGRWCFSSLLPSSLSSFLCSSESTNLSPTPSLALEKSYFFPSSQCFTLEITKVDPAPPAGEKEKIKIYNPHHFSVELSNYQLDDEVGGSQPLDLEGSIGAGQEKSFSLTTGIWNNSGDDVRLLCDSKVIAGVSYQKVINHQILILDKNGDWCFYDRGYWPINRSYLDCSLFQDEESLPLVISSKRNPPLHYRRAKKKRKPFSPSNLEVVKEVFSISLFRPLKVGSQVSYFLPVIFLFLGQGLVFLVLTLRRRKRVF